MKTVAVVAWREIVEHRVFLIAALATLAVTLVVPLIPAFLGWHSGDVREVLMWLMALGFSWLSAVFLGASMVTGAVADGRFGFFLDRPVSGAALWFGKLLGVLAVVLTCQLLVVAPAVLLSNVADVFETRVALGQLERDLVAVGSVVAAPVLMVLLAHTVATMWRGRSAWVLVDLVALALAVVVGWAALAPLLSARAEVAATVIGMLLVGGAAVAVIAAGSVQTASGRCDGRRQHRAFSMVLWPLLLSASAGAGAYSAWLMHPSAEDLVGVEQLVVQPAGDWIVVSGPTRGRLDVAGSFLLDLKRRVSRRLELGPTWERGSVAAFSGDGKLVVWPGRDGTQWRIRHGTLGELMGGARDSKILLYERPSLVMSSSGKRMATIEGESVVVTALDTSDLICSARLMSSGQRSVVYFADENRVRVLFLKDGPGADGPSLRALELNCPDGKVVETGAIPGVSGFHSADIDRTRDRLLLRTDIDGSMHCHYVDARTLESIDWPAERKLGVVARMLADGRLLRLVNEGEQSWLERLTPHGEVDARVQLPGTPQRVVVGSEPTVSSVVIAVTDREQWNVWWEDFRLLLVDLATGQSREIGRGLPVRSWLVGAVGSPLPAGSAAARLFFGEGHSLRVWDPVTGRMEPVVRGRG